MHNILISVDSKRELYKTINALIDIIVIKNDQERDEFLLNKMQDNNFDIQYVLDIGFAEHKIEYVLNNQWFHRKLRNLFTNVRGVDYESELVSQIAVVTGYRDLYSFDATKPMSFDCKFDLIHAGDLIEHVLNIEGLFFNFKNLLKDSGKIFISTPNPQSYYYVKDLLFNGVTIPNSDHVSWIDPGNIYEICRRTGFYIDRIYAPISPKRNMVSLLKKIMPGVKRFMAGEYIYVIRKC